MCSLGMCQPCMAIPMYTSKLMSSQPQSRENTKLEWKSVPLHSTQWNPFISYKKCMMKLLRAESCSRIKIRSFLLKTYLENHKLMVDGKMDQHISKPINTMVWCVKNSNQGYWERKHVRSKKDKNSYTSYYHIHTNTDMFIQYTTKSVVSLEKAYKILWYHSKMIQLFAFHVYTTEKHM